MFSKGFSLQKIKKKETKKSLGHKSKSINKISVSKSEFRAIKHQSRTVESSENNEATNFPEGDNQQISEEMQGNVMVSESDFAIVQAKLPSESGHYSRCQLTVSPIDYSRQTESSHGIHLVTPTIPPSSTSNEYQEKSQTSERHSLNYSRKKFKFRLLDDQRIRAGLSLTFRMYFMYHQEIFIGKLHLLNLLQ